MNRSRIICPSSAARHACHDRRRRRRIPVAGPPVLPELLHEISGRLDAGADQVRFHAVCWPWRDTLDRPLRFPPWPDLPPEVLRNISGRLHAAADFARFHAVCWRWHSTLRHTPSFLPWLLAPSATDGGMEDQRCRCVFSGTSSLAPGICFRDRRVACGDGTAAWLLAAAGHRETEIVDPLTADRLPFSREDAMKNDHDWPESLPHRTVSGDGTDTIFFYDFTPYPPGSWLPPGVEHPYSYFEGAFVCPGDEHWWCVSEGLGTDRCCAAVYFQGLVVCVDLVSCYFVKKTRVALPDEPAGKVRRWSYLLVSTDGELLLASVLQDAGGGPADLSVSLQAVFTAAADHGDELVVEWARRDDDVSLLDEDAMFLGFPGSFAVEAELFEGEVSAGAAYFVMAGDSSSDEAPCSVYRYSFHDGTTTVVETLPPGPGWRDPRCMWFLPQPKITRIPARMASTRRQELRIYAGDLSPKVDTYRLRQMFSVYGKVASARVAYDKRGRSRGFGFVTMATQQGFDKAMAAFNAVEKPPSLINPFNLFVTLLILLTAFALFYFFTFQAFSGAS